MKKSFFLILIIALIISCKTENYNLPDLFGQINRRIEILENSFKFSVIHENLHDEIFDKLKEQIDNVQSESKIDVQVNHNVFKDLFLKYHITFADKSESIRDLSFNILIGLDELIFKYLPSRLNLSEYKAIVVPNKTQILLGDTLNAKIFLTVSDSLYEPKIQYLDTDFDDKVKKAFNLPCDNGIGEFNMVTSTKGNKKLKGILIYSNEFGSKDTIDWNYEFIVE